jgi:tetratricopeptide (TPR) repeat protein
LKPIGVSIAARVVSVGVFVGVFVDIFVGVGLPSGFSPSARADEARDAAHEHFDRALAASNAQRFGEAAEEFQKAYELWPDYKVLYNIGRVRIALGQPVEVVDAFEAYLTKGGAEITDERRDEVRKEIEAQQSRIATLTVETSAEGADLRLDGRLVGHSPLPGPLRVAAGKHTLEALLPDRPTQVRELDLAGGAATEVTLNLPPRPALAAPVPASTRVPATSLLGAPSEAARKRRTMGYVVGGVGVVALLAGAAVAVESALAANDAKARLVAAATPSPPGTPDVAQYDAAKHTYDDAKTRNQLGWTLGGLGVAALVGGATMVFVSSGAPAGPAPGVSADVVVHAGGLAVRGRW